jgi:peptidoglycan hydrolase CwlO-like protein
MKNINLLVSGIEFKTRKLVNSYKDIQNEITQLNEKIKSLQHTIDEQKEVIKNLEEKNKTIKIAKTLDKGKETLDSRLKINELVREIDKCIDLLNK